MKRSYRSTFVGKGTLVHAIRLDAEGRDDAWTLCGRDFRDEQGKAYVTGAGALPVSCSRCVSRQGFDAYFDRAHNPKTGTEALEDFVQHLRATGDGQFGESGNDGIIEQAQRYLEGWKADA